MFPAAATTMLSAAYASRWNEASARRPTLEITSARPITGRPTEWPPKTASATTSWTRSCGLSSTMAISSSTTSRSESTSAKTGS